MISLTDKNNLRAFQGENCNDNPKWLLYNNGRLFKNNNY